MFSYKIDDRLELKPLQDHHAAALFALVDANRDHLYEHMLWVDKTHKQEDTLEYIKNTKKDWMETSSITCGIWVDGAIAGTVGLHRIDWPNRKTTIGYWLAKNHTGKGHMTRSVSAILDYAFHDLKLNHIAIKADTHNTPSRAIAERLGFTHEGTLRDDMLNRKCFINHELYGMRAEEWKSHKRQKS